MKARLLWLALGWAALGLAVIGTLLPVLPTVPFLLVAAWAFAESSPELRERIRGHRRYGATVRAWQDRGVVPRLAKIWAIGAMGFGVALSAWVGMPVWVVAIQATICLTVAIWLLGRPER